MQQGPTLPKLHKKQTSGDTFCGADRGGYKWSQTITDLDILVPVPCEIKSGSHVKVEACAERVKIGWKSGDYWKFAVDGKLRFKIKPNEVIWSLDSGKQVFIHLEKLKEMWWESLLEDEPKLNLEEYELSRPLCDLSEEEEMTLQNIWKKQLEKKPES